ncbi:MAG TPA: hypothetical protein VLR51_00140 [Actinomycetes bacterium]|nr:hypothetical protein [Actinomycetes bacterium]
MKLYAETAGLRARQLLGDLGVLAWTAVWVAAGLTLYRLVEKLAVPGARVEQAGSNFAGDVAEIQQKVGRLPVVGNELQGPFGRLSGVGRTLADAGATQQEVVHQLALWLGVVVAAVPIVVLLLVWLPRRVAWAREAGAASRLRLDGADLELFALRAVANRSLRELHKVTPDPAGDLRAGEFEALADLELRALGLRAGSRPPPPP